MTDEEMARLYLIEKYGLRKDLEIERIQHSVCLSLEFYTYLAGLKAGRPKWHDLRKNPDDLPPIEKGTATIDVLTDSGRLAYYFYDESCWYDTHSDEIYPPKAWCEIPKYTEE